MRRVLHERDIRALFVINGAFLSFLVRINGRSGESAVESARHRSIFEQREWRSFSSDSNVIAEFCCRLWHSRVQKNAEKERQRFCDGDAIKIFRPTAAKFSFECVRVCLCVYVASYYISYNRVM